LDVKSIGNLLDVSILLAKQAPCRKIVSEGHLEASGISSFRLGRNGSCLHGEDCRYNTLGNFCKPQNRDRSPNGFWKNGLTCQRPFVTGSTNRNLNKNEEIDEYP
jgi:hypothetical protein